MHAALATFWNYDYQVQDETTPDGEWRTETPPQKSLPGVAATSYAPVVNAADTIEWITARESEDSDKPWFVWLASNLSHATAQRAPSQMAVPDADTLDAASAQEMRECGGEFGTQNVGSCSGEAQLRAMTSSLDTTLGKVLEAVDDLDPNTYVIYIGDNGTPMYGRPGLDFIDNMYITRSGRGKGTVYESGARVPLVIRGPRIAAGSESTEYAHAADLYSTILALAGLAVPEKVSSSDGNGTVALDAVSLAPILFDGASAVRDPNLGYVLTETHDLMRGGIREVGARNKNYKVLCTNGAASGDCTFYNVADDPLEEYPLAMPEACDKYKDGSWTPADAAWHYCRLTEVVGNASFL
jgi:arylsulfatase A-like enzyme